MDLNFTGRDDLLASYAELRMDIFRARCRGRVDHDAEERQVAIALALREGVERPSAALSAQRGGE